MRYNENLTPIVATAYHAAGHAVVADLLYGNIEYATIIPDAETFGCVQRRVHLRTPKDRFMGIIISTAGHAAELKAETGDIYLPALIEELEEWDFDKSCVVDKDFGDSVRINELLQNISYSRGIQYDILLDAVGRLRELFRNPVVWRAIRNVAHSLLKQKTLSRFEISDLVDAEVKRSKWRWRTRFDAGQQLLRKPEALQCSDDEYHLRPPEYTAMAA